MEDRYIATVDLGTSKIALCVAKVEDEHVTVIYYRETPSDGILYSTVINPRKASVPLGMAISEAEKELGIKISQVAVGLPRYRIRQEAASSKVQRSNPDELISEEEVESLGTMALGEFELENAADQEIYGAVIQSYSADDFIQGSAEDIIGTASASIEGNYKLFVGAKKAVRNLDLLFNPLGVAIARRYFLPDASARAVLTEAEMQGGVALVEIGGGVSSVTVYHGGILRYYGSIPFGGKVVTSDIRMECGLHTELAENIKLAYGACLPDRLQSLEGKVLQISDDETASYPELQVKYLSQIITARMREILEAVLFLIQESGYADRLRCGVVLTGGGAELVNTGVMLGEMSGYTVRPGFPRIKGLSHQGCEGLGEMRAAATVGMLLEARSDRYLVCAGDAAPSEEEHVDLGGTVFAPEPEQKPEPRRKPQKPAGGGLFSKLKKSAEKGFDDTIGGLFDDMQ